MSGRTDVWRIVTMTGELLGEGDTIGKATLAAAEKRYDGISTVLRPGEDLAEVLERVTSDLRRGLGMSWGGVRHE